MAKNPRTGGTLEEYFTEKGELEEVNEIAMRRMLADELGKFLKQRSWTRVRLAAELQTSRPQVDRLLDPQPRKSITTTTLARAAAVIGKRLALVDA
jgi:ABC-type cobalamin transport system ATPase subunit